MDEQSFLNHIDEKFRFLNQTRALISNIINYVEDQGFVDVEDSHDALNHLLEGVIPNDVIEKYQTKECELCTRAVLPYDEQEFDTVCEACWEFSKTI